MNQLPVMKDALYNNSSDNLGLGNFLPWSLQWKTVSMEVQRDFNHFNTFVTKEYLWTLFWWINILMLIWLGRGHLFALDSHGFFSPLTSHTKMTR